MNKIKEILAVIKQKLAAFGGFLKEKTAPARAVLAKVSDKTGFTKFIHPASLDKRKARNGWIFVLPFLIGILFSTTYELVYIGIALFSLSLVFQLVTLPVEFNASRRAMEAIESSEILSGDELKGARRTLTAAAMTYVAATLVAVMQLLRLLAIFSKKRDLRRNSILK